MLDNEATLTFWQGSEAVRYVSGIVTGFAQGESGFSRTRYKMVIEPSLSRARYQSDNKIFQQQNSEKILRTLLQKNQVSQVDFSLTNADWVREYCVQYRETDLAFIERLAAEDLQCHAVRRPPTGSVMAFRLNRVEFGDGTDFLV